MFKLKSIKAKLLAILLLSLALLGLTSLVTTSRLSTNINDFDTVIQSTLTAQKYALVANLEFKRQVQEWKNTLIRGADSKQMDKYWGRFNERHKTTQDYVNKLIPLLNDYPDLAAIAKQFLNDHNVMKSAYSDGRDKYVAANFDISLGDKSVSGIDRAPSAALDDIVEQLSVLANEQTLLVESSATSNIRFSFIAIIVIILLVIYGVYVSIERLISRPLRSVRRKLVALAEGDLTVTSNYEGDDEIGTIANSARQLQSFLHENIDTMKSTSTALTEAAFHMESMSTKLSAQANNQMQSTNQVATAIQELTYSADEVAKNSKQNSEVTQQTSSKTNESTITANDAQKGAESLVTKLTAGALVIQELADNASNVSSVLDVIRGIAEQTNLLALNAAIEAARAGEQGRGFAVVADEVRTLAQRTQDSTAEIENILESVKSGADKAVVAMDSGQESSQEVKEEITQATVLLNEIANMVEEISNNNIQIARSASEQTTVSNSVAELVQNIYGLSEATSEQVEETKKVSQELKNLVLQFQSTIERFSL